MTMQTIDLSRSVPEGQFATAARLYCEALQVKLKPFMGPPDRAARVLATGLRPDRAIVALRDGEVVGIAGFKLDGTGLFEPPVSAFTREYGTVSGVIRMLGLGLLERSETAGQLLMDGIAVSESARGQGIGSRLLTAIIALAEERRVDAVRLDVIDTNPRARVLYERFGFIAQKTSQLGPFRLLFPFSASTEMIRPVRARSE